MVPTTTNISQGNKDDKDIGRRLSEHIVKEGDELNKIAKQYGVPLEVLKDLNKQLQDRIGPNGLKGYDYLVPGDKIQLHGDTTKGVDKNAT